MFFQKLISIIPDIVQIIILYFAIYAILRAARGSRFGQVLMGIVVLFSMMIALSYFFHFVVLAKIVNLNNSKHFLCVSHLPENPIGSIVRTYPEFSFSLSALLPS
jgi:DNA integrity scanning protein DisA with diadenylate cyclase activity